MRKTGVGQGSEGGLVSDERSRYRGAGPLHGKFTTAMFSLKNHGSMQCCISSGNPIGGPAGSLKFSAAILLSVSGLWLLLGGSFPSQQISAQTAAQNTTPNTRPRASDLGLKVGILPTGPLDAITDVSGVEVGQTTIIRGDNIRTGVTAVLPHSGNLYREKVPGAIFVGNGFGKLTGSTQVDEMGDIETPILLTSTTSVPRVADALISYMLALPGNEDVLSINPVVGETNDGYLSDIRGRHITPDDVFAAIKNAKGGPVEEGDVGAGTGTVAFRMERRHRDVIAPLACQTRRIHGRRAGADEFRRRVDDCRRSRGPGTGSVLPAQGSAAAAGNGKDKADGSCMIVVATDAPMDARNLKRLAARALVGMARTGSSASNGSGDYAIAFSTAPQVRIHPMTKR